MGNTLFVFFNKIQCLSVLRYICSCRLSVGSGPGLLWKACGLQRQCWTALLCSGLLCGEGWGAVELNLCLSLSSSLSLSLMNCRHEAAPGWMGWAAALVIDSEAFAQSPGRVSLRKVTDGNGLGWPQPNYGVSGGTHRSSLRGDSHLATLIWGGPAGEMDDKRIKNDWPGPVSYTHTHTRHMCVQTYTHTHTQGGIELTRRKEKRWRYSSAQASRGLVVQRIQSSPVLRRDGAYQFLPRDKAARPLLGFTARFPAFLQKKVWQGCGTIIATSSWGFPFSLATKTGCDFWNYCKPFSNYFLLLSASPRSLLLVLSSCAFLFFGRELICAQ